MKKTNTSERIHMTRTADNGINQALGELTELFMDVERDVSPVGLGALNDATNALQAARAALAAYRKAVSK